MFFYPISLSLGLPHFPYPAISYPRFSCSARRFQSWKSKPKPKPRFIPPVMSCSSSDPPAFCADDSPELKLSQALIFSVPVFFTFILLALFYVFYLRRRRASWDSLRMRTPYQPRADMPTSSSELGIEKEFRDLLPVVVFKESFLIRETQCSVCLGDYKSDECLKRIPPCGHTFHVDCIDSWLSAHTTCPLCRVSLIPVARNLPNPETLQEEEVEEAPQRDAAIAMENREVVEVREDGDGSRM